MSLIDISRSVSPATAVWPGDQEVEWAWTRRLEQEGASVNLGSICLSTHTGTHVDAPYHVRNDGKKTDGLSLDAFVGMAQVVDIGSNSSIRPEHVRRVASTAPPRILFRTSASALGSDEWPGTVAPISPETVRFLSEAGTVLVGTDAPSVDPLDSTELPAHHALLEAEIVHLEGLALANVPAGQYELIALPLKIPDSDASPVRAVLRDGPAR